MKNLALVGILMLISGFAGAEQCYVNKSGAVRDLALEMKSQKVFSSEDTDVLSLLLISLNNDKIGVPENFRKSASLHIQVSLEEIKSKKLQKALKKVALKQLEDEYDKGKYSQSDALEIWERFYAPRISEIVKGRRDLLSRILKVLENAEIADCAAAK
ncbi:hypothetical protein HZA41_01585 [Candidatus Peregrinibacteria bacterium]|nr:hypothetical protein [Candidatus Peregrinibacteria bacterium]